MTEYSEIFFRAEKSIKKHSWFTDDEFRSHYDQFKNFENKQRSDKEIFNLLVMIIFYSGFRASTVEKKESTIL